MTRGIALAAIGHVSRWVAHRRTVHTPRDMMTLFELIYTQLIKSQRRCLSPWLQSDTWSRWVAHRRTVHTPRDMITLYSTLFELIYTQLIKSQRRCLTGWVSQSLVLVLCKTALQRMCTKCTNARVQKHRCVDLFSNSLTPRKYCNLC